MKRTGRLGCGGKELITDNLDDASRWLLDNVAGLKSFNLKIVIHSEDTGCSMLKYRNNPPKLPMKLVQLGNWGKEES